MIRKEDIEALLADYLEGRLDPRRAKEVEEYIASLTDEGDDPAGPETVLRPENVPPVDFGALKLPVGPDDAETREKLYNLAIDGELDEGEAKCFEALMLRAEFRLEYETVKKSVLRAPVVHMDKSTLYRHGEPHRGKSTAPVHHPLSADTPRPTAEMLRAASWEDVPRLKPPTGVFYPNKRELYRKEAKVFGLWYRVGAAAAVLLLLWMLPFHSDRDQERLSLSPIQLKVPQVERPQPGLPAMLETLPADPVQVAFDFGNLQAEEISAGELAVEHSDHPRENPDENISDASVAAESQPEEIELEPLEPEVVTPAQDADWEDLTADGSSGQAREQASVNSEEYVTIPQWITGKTQEIIAAETTPDPDAIASTLKRKAAELLDAEVSKNTVSTPEGQRQTFAVRIGGIGFERSTSR